jgi:hypothetical protein
VIVVLRQFSNFSAIKNPTQRVGLEQSGLLYHHHHHHHHPLIEN